MSQTALFFGLASHRLRARCRWAGLTLLLTVLIPYEVIDNKPQFLWQLIGELPAAGALAALAPLLAGAAVLIASRFARRGTSLAVAVLAALATAAALFRLGADAAAWDVLPVPDSLAEHPLSAILALALTAAGVNLAWKPHCRPVARGVLAAAVAFVALYYLRPAHGSAPILTAGRFLGAIVTLPYWRLKLGFMILAAIALAPAGIALAGLRSAYRPPTREQPLIGVIAIYGPAAIMIALVYRSFFSAAVGAEILASIGTAFLVAGVLALLASSIEVLGEAAVTPEVDLDQPPGLALRRTVAIALGASITLCAAQAVLARPPAKGVEWSLQPATAGGDALFGELVPAWNDARIRWVAAAAGAEDAESGELEAAARAMIDAADALDPGLGGALSQLARDALDLNAAGRRFYRLVHEVNEASRRAGLPYYLDPTISISQTGDGLVRRLQVLSFRIERVRGFMIGSSPFATLHVRSIGLRRANHQRLGFSRDLQPFALVVLDETEPFARSLAAAASAPVPTCGRSGDAGAKEGLERCGEVLAALAQASLEPAPGPRVDESGFEHSLVAMTERHELQHQIDGPHLPIAAAVERRLPTSGEEAKERVNRELSAYVAEITAPDAPPKLGLIHLVRFALTGRGGTEHHVAMIVLDVLRGREAQRAGGAFDASAVTEAFLDLTALSDDELRARAASAWRSLFGAALPDIHPR